MDDAELFHARAREWKTATEYVKWWLGAYRDEVCLLSAAEARERCLGDMPSRLLPAHDNLVKTAFQKIFQAAARAAQFAFTVAVDPADDDDVEDADGEPPMVGDNLDERPRTARKTIHQWTLWPWDEMRQWLVGRARMSYADQQALRRDLEAYAELHAELRINVAREFVRILREARAA